jgi:hypothetical protein
VPSVCHAPGAISAIFGVSIKIANFVQSGWFSTPVGQPPQHFAITVLSNRSMLVNPDSCFLSASDWHELSVDLPGTSLEAEIRFLSFRTIECGIFFHAALFRSFQGFSVPSI